MVINIKPINVNLETVDAKLFTALYLTNQVSYSNEDMDKDYMLIESASKDENGNEIKIKSNGDLSRFFPLEKNGHLNSTIPTIS